MIMPYVMGQTHGLIYVTAAINIVTYLYDGLTENYEQIDCTI